MALIVKDRVQETTSTTGTGTLTLSGAVSGFQTFSSAIGNTNTTYYSIVGDNQWEVGIGTVAAGTLSRDTILSSSTGSAVSFNAGVKNVFCTYPADKAVTIDDVQTLTNKTLTSPTLTTPALGTPASGALTNCTGYTYANLSGTVPTWNQNTTGTAANVTGTVAIINGGTGQTTRQNAMDALAGATTSGQYLRGNGTDVVMANIVAGDVPTLNQNTTGSSGSCTGNAATATTATTATTANALNTGNSYTGTAFTVAQAQPYLIVNRNSAASGQMGIQFQNAGTSLWWNYLEASATTMNWYNSVSSSVVMSLTTGGALNVTGTISASNLSGTNTGDQTNISGNAATATKLSTASGSAPSYSARAWVSFNGTGTVAIRASGNVSSITDNGTGSYTINFTTAMADAEYAVITSAQGTNTSNLVGPVGTYGTNTGGAQLVAPTTSAYRISTWASNLSGQVDVAYVMTATFR
jgi:hypothetical protein